MSDAPRSRHLLALPTRALFRKRHPPVGARPGTLVIDESAPPPTMRVIDFAAETVEERVLDSVDEVADYLQRESVTWIDVQGLGDETLLRRLGEVCHIHALALEDAVNVPQRPKAESYEEHQLFITRMLRLLPEAELDTEQVSIFIGKTYVLTLQERPGDTFEPVRARIREGKGPIRRLGPDYLAYALIDTIIDGYYPVLEQLGEYLLGLEESAFEQPRRSTLRRIQRVRHELLRLRRAVWPQREAINSMIRDENPLVTGAVRLYLRDCYDHAIQVIDVTENFREVASNLMDIYLSSLSNRTNEVMKVLTIMASIFIPLTFLAGVYGMNFEYMPELHRRWAYPIVLVLMLAIALTMIVYFWRKGWIGGRED